MHTEERGFLTFLTDCNSYNAAAPRWSCRQVELLWKYARMLDRCANRPVCFAWTSRIVRSTIPLRVTSISHLHWRCIPRIGDLRFTVLC